MRLFLFVFFIVNLLLSSIYLDQWYNGNTTSRALPIISYFEIGTFQIDRYHEMTEDKAHIGEHFYTDKAPLPTFIVLPFFGFLKSIGIIQPDEQGSFLGGHIYLLGGFLIGSIPFSIIVLLLFKKIRINKFNLSPVVLAMIPLYGSFIFVFSGTYFAHLLSGLFLLLSYIKLKSNNYILSGIFAGLTFLCEFNLALLFLFWAIQLILRTKSIKPFILFSFGVLPSIAIIGVYNYIFTGAAYDMLYKYHTYSELHNNYGFSLPSLESIWGLSFSSYKGLLFYTPILILVLIKVIKPVYSMNARAIALNYLILPSTIYFLVIAGYFGWWGGWTYGPRLLFGIAILLCYEGIVFLSRSHIHTVLFWVVTLFGLVTAFLAKITVIYSVPSDVKNTIIDLLIPKLLNGELHQNNIFTMLWKANTNISALIWIVAFTTSIIFLSQWYQRLKIKANQ